MQIGRWTHQSTGNNARGSRSARNTRSGGENSGYGSRPSRGNHRFERNGGGYGNRRRSASFGNRPQRRNRGGIGAFGQTEAEIQKFINRADPVAEQAETPFVPTLAFADLDIDPRLKKNIEAKGYTTPSPIQDAAIPHVLEGKDVVGLAETGSGKTAAFLVPLIDKVMRSARAKHPERVLVMAPTRELAVQIEQELASFAKGLGFRGVVAVGGANIAPQMRALKLNPAFVIGTPGRLKDLMERKALDLSGFGTVVLDEADRMLDMGFIDDMRFILSKMNPERHTLFFSATMSKEIERLVGDFLKEPIVVSVKKRDTSKNVDQDVVRLGRGEDKFEKLVALLQDRDFTRVLIFGRTKYGVEKLAKALSRAHLHAESIHGDKTQRARQRALEAFKRGQVNVLVATDVAARGLDIPAVSHVINYDLPSTYEDYVHRIGRTGRASMKGKALTFVGE